MTSEIRVPALGESVTEATVGQWFKKAGDAVNADEPVVELETDKVTIEVPAPVSGVLADVLVGEGDTVEVGALLGAITEGDGVAAAPAKAETKSEPTPAKGTDDDAGHTLSPAVQKLVRVGVRVSETEGSHPGWGKTTYAGCWNSMTLPEGSLQRICLRP